MKNTHTDVRKTDSFDEIRLTSTIQLLKGHKLNLFNPRFTIEGNFNKPKNISNHIGHAI